MFTIYDGRDYFWQWDSNQRLVVNDAVCCEVHFCNKTGDCSLVCEVYEENGQRLVDVPNILFQNAQSITAFAYVRNEDESYTRHAKIFMVRPRTKPEDYVYTETEVLSYSSLDKRLQDLEGEGIANAVAAYLEENPVQTGATDEEAAQIEQNKADIEKLDNEKLSTTALNDAIDSALAEAKESGMFDGSDGDPGKDGSPGKDGKTPVKGEDYFTDTDKQEIAQQAAGLVDVPTQLPNPHPMTFTGAVEGRYDGSEPFSVDIPSGSGEWILLTDITLTEETNGEIINVSQTDSGEEFSCDAILIDFMPTTAGGGWFKISKNSTHALINGVSMGGIYSGFTVNKDAFALWQPLESVGYLFTYGGVDITAKNVFTRASTEAPITSLSLYRAAVGFGAGATLKIYGRNK